MNTAARHPLVEDYLCRLRTEAARLPRDQAEGLVADIDEHLEAALGEDPSEAEVRNALDRLGSPEELVAEAAGPAGATSGPRAKPFASPTGAVVCLVAAEVLCLLLPVSVPLWIIGLVLMARATVWTEREKWLGFLGLGSGFPVVFVSLFLSVIAVRGCSQVYENGRLVSDTCSGVDWVAVVVWSVTVGYLAFQVFTIWKLVRSMRRR